MSINFVQILSHETSPVLLPFTALSASMERTKPILTAADHRCFYSTPFCMSSADTGLPKPRSQFLREAVSSASVSPAPRKSKLKLSPQEPGSDFEGEKNQGGLVRLKKESDI